MSSRPRPNAAADVVGASLQRARTAELVSFVLNGQPVSIGVPTHWTLLEALRYVLKLTGTKQGCDKGDCGACTVVVDGRAQLSCLTLAVRAEGADITTVEGLGVGRAHPLQDAFEVSGAAQCGFCTPGMLMSAVAFLQAELASDTPNVDRETIAAALGGNLCRCTGYTKILDAVHRAWRDMSADGGAA